jgi:hypothetical protein
MGTERRSVAAPHRVLVRGAALRHHLDPFYVCPTREPDEAQRAIESAKSFGRPVVATEALGRPNHGQLHEILPLFNEGRIGWYLWELMIGADQTRYQWPNSPPVADEIVFQGLLYPDGTPYSEDEIVLIQAQARNALDPRSPAGIATRISTGGFDHHE